VWITVEAVEVWMWYGMDSQLASCDRLLACLGLKSTDHTNRGSVDNGRLRMADTGTRLIVCPPQTQAGCVLWVFVASQIAEIREGAAKVVPVQRGADAKYY
jgi:hypothetical protein